MADLGGRDVTRAKRAGSTEGHRAVLLWQWQQLCRHLGADTHPREITPRLATVYEGARREEGAKGQTITRELQALRRGLSDAEDEGVILAAPTKWHKVRRDPSDVQRSGKAHRADVLASWLAALHLDARDQAYLALTTGLRAAELKRIEWPWVDEASAMLAIPGASTKARKPRTVALSPEAVAILKRRAEHIAGPLLPGQHTTAFRLASKRIGYGRITLRDLRHTFGTWTAQGVGVDATRGALGHADLSTSSRYVSTEAYRLVEAAQHVAGKLAQSESAQAEKGRKMVGAAGFELATSSSQIQQLTLYRIARAFPGGVDAAIECLRGAMSAQGSRHRRTGTVTLAGRGGR